VLELLQKEINDTIISMIKVRGDPETDNYVGAIFPSIEASIARVTDSSRHFTTEKLSKMGEKYEVRFRESLENDTWLNDFPGRKILKRFVASHLSGIGYEPFVNLVLDKLAEQNRQPVGMKNILDKIMKA
jgi:hypothetical protein